MNVPRPKKWPSYLLDVLEAMRYQFRETQRLTALAQEKLLEGKHEEAIVILGHVRVGAMWGVSLTWQAYHGSYQEGGDPTGLTKGKSPAGTGLRSKE